MDTRNRSRTDLQPKRRALPNRRQLSRLEMREAQRGQRAVLRGELGQTVNNHRQLFDQHR